MPPLPRAGLRPAREQTSATRTTKTARQRLRRSSLNQVSRLNVERVSNPSEHGNAGGNVRTFDCADIAGAQPGAFGQFLLRHFFGMTQPTQIDRHDLLVIHDEMGTDLGTIIPGTILPNRTQT